MPSLDLLSSIRVHLLTAVLCCTVSCSSAAGEIDDLIIEVMAAKQIPGLQLAVGRGGKIIKTGNYGLSNLQDSVAVSDETRFPINSMTKAFTGVAVMQLAEQGKLTLDDTIDKHLADLPEAWLKLTIRQLMSHTSGLPNILRGKAKLIKADDPESSWQAVRTSPMQFKANTRFAYNQTGYILIGKIIDKLSGQSFTQFITEQQLQPLEMTKTADAGFGYFEYVVPNQARQYYFGPDGRLHNLHAEFAPFLRAAAGMTSSATELAHYAIALQQGNPLKLASLAEMWTATTLENGQTAGFNDLENGYGIGWQIISREKHPAVSASGGNATTLIIYPDDDLVIVVLTNLVGALPISFVDDIAALYLSEGI
jgi:CubicO group peptidase (beta-lactamase class C family)